MRLQSNGKLINTEPILKLLKQGENNADFIQFDLCRYYGNESLDLSTFSFMIYAYSQKKTVAIQTLTKAEDENFIRLGWTVSKDFTAVGGKLLLTIIGTEPVSGKIIKFTGQPIIVEGEPTASENPPGLGAFEEAILTMQAILEENKLVAVSTPYIAENGHWMVYNNTEKKYTDSGIKAQQGEKGDTGLTGENGTNGVDGAPGADGKSAYQIAKENGSILTEPEFNCVLAGVGASLDVLDKTTDFLPDGSILEASAFTKITTEFLSDGSIREMTKDTLTNATLYTKTIFFLQDGNINEVISK